MENLIFFLKMSYLKYSPLVSNYETLTVHITTYILKKLNVILKHFVVGLSLTVLPELHSSPPPVTPITVSEKSDSSTHVNGTQLGLTPITVFEKSDSSTHVDETQLDLQTSK